MYVAIVQPRCLCTVRFTDHLKPSQVKLVQNTRVGLGGVPRVAPTLTHRLWGCVGEVVGSPRADRCVLRVCDDRGATAFGVRPR